MKELDVCLTPDLIELHDLKGKVVVIVDILRATSCITTGIAHGVKSIRPVATLAECKDLQNQGYVAAAERGGLMVDGFDLGNSPFAYMTEELKDRTIAMTTTNGTIALSKSLAARQIIIGSFLNLSSVINYLKKQPYDIVIHCAGWKGRINLEDSLFAGAVVDGLKGNCQMPNDAPRMAMAVYQQANSDLLGFLADCSHVNRLRKLGLDKDIEFCLQRDKYNLIPVLKDDHLIKMGLSDMLV